MAFGLNEIVLIVSLVGVGLAYKYVKDSKSKKQVMAGGAAVAIFVLLLGGAFGYPPVLSAAGGPAGGAPVAGSLWEGVIDAADSDTDTDRTETELASPDGHGVLWIMSDANMDGLGDIGIEVDLYNLNDGKTTDIWGTSGSIVKVGNIIVSGIPTPVANYTTDRSRFNVAWAEGTTFTAGDVIQNFDKAVITTTSRAAESVTALFPIDPTVADDNPAGAQFQVVVSMGGIVFTMTLQES